MGLCGEIRGEMMKKRVPVLLLVCLLALVLWVVLEQRWIQVTPYTVKSPDLPEAFSGMRVTELADVHGTMFGEEQEDLLQKVRETKPDLIAIDGDLFDVNTDISELDVLLTGLCEIAPTYYVTGNHEWVTDNLYETLDHFRELGVVVLDNTYVVLESQGQQMVVAGVHDPNGPYDMKTPAELVEEIRRDVGEDTYILMLAHRNGQLAMWAELGVQTVLVGHGHGGLIRLPFVGGLLDVEHNLFPVYDAGLFHSDKTTMVVSRGLGNSIWIPRIFNRPDLPVITLESGA